VVHLSPRLREVEPYPFEALDRRKAEALEAGRTIVDFGVGDPREETSAIVRDALVDAIGPISSYPRAAGLPPLRRAIAAWVQHRYGVALDLIEAGRQTKRWKRLDHAVKMTIPVAETADA